MNFRVTLATLLIIALPALAAAATDRVTYDGHCLQIDGKDVFIYSGAFHYFRCPKELWPDRFAKIKAAGFNCVETYVAWNWHEQEKPDSLTDFSKVKGLEDVREWMKMAHEQFGLYTIIRPGPYICAEWAGGGYPAWLQTFKPKDYPAETWVRSDEPAYLAWSKHWMDAVVPTIAAEQITRKPVGQPGVILFQIENEYDLYGPPTVAMRNTHLKSLFDAAKAGGIDVPIFTCVTRTAVNNPLLPGVFNCLNFYPRWGIGDVGRGLDASKKAQPNAPGAVTELQGGWFSGVGGQLAETQDGITGEQQNGITLIAMAHGATILNYYMLFGGTNFGDWGSRGQTTTYDYAAAIREDGSTGAKYEVVSAIGAMLKVIGPSLARSEKVDCEIEGAGKDVDIVLRRGADGQRFVFVWNRSRTTDANGSAVLKIAGGEKIAFDYTLRPFDYRVLAIAAGEADASKGKWFAGRDAISDGGRKMVPPLPIKATAFAVIPESGPTEWADIMPGQSLADAGVYDSRFVMYRAKATLTTEQLKQASVLQLDLFAEDHVVVKANGRFAPSPPRDTPGSLEVGPLLHEGENEIEVLYENLGYANFGVINLPAGLRGGGLEPPLAGRAALTDWRVHLLENGESADAMIDEAFDDSKWPEGWFRDRNAPAAIAQPGVIQPGATTQPTATPAKHTGPNALRVLDEKVDATAVFRTTFDLPSKDGVTTLKFDSLDDEGTVYLNGNEIGKAKRWNEKLSLDISNAARVGKNSVAVVVTNRDRGGGIARLPRVQRTTDKQIALTWQIGKRLSGETRNFATLGADEAMASGITGSPEETDADRGPFVTWTLSQFDLPASAMIKERTFFANIDATGNGPLYLNGHPLGRYWQVGPQRRYYLPEPWLKAGTNLLTAELRRTEKAGDVKSITIESGK